MAINKLTEEASVIYDIICAAGAITTEQVKKICEGKDINAEGTVRILCAERYTKWIDETYSIPFHKTNIDFQAIACLWVMLNMITKPDGTVSLASFAQMIGGSNIVKFTYLQGNAAVVNMVYIGENDFSKIPASKQRFYDYTNCKKGEEKNEKVVYLFVTSSLKAVAEIQDATLPFPHKIAYIEDEKTSNPAIRYF